MTEEIEGATEALQKEATEAPTEAPIKDQQKLHKNTSKKPQKELSREAYVCSVCGATVVPIEHETDRGIRYRCPECGRFMRPLTPEDVKEKEEEGRPLLRVLKRVLEGCLEGANTP